MHVRIERCVLHRAFKTERCVEDFMTPTVRIIQAEQPAKAHCALGHWWDARWRVERDRYATKREGRRPTHQFHSIVTPERCPTCGQKWAQLH